MRLFDDLFAQFYVGGRQAMVQQQKWDTRLKRQQINDNGNWKSTKTKEAKCVKNGTGRWCKVPVACLFAYRVRRVCIWKLYIGVVWFPFFPPKCVSLQPTERNRNADLIEFVEIFAKQTTKTETRTNVAMFNFANCILNLAVCIRIVLYLIDLRFCCCCCYYDVVNNEHWTWTYNIWTICNHIGFM